LRLVLVVPLRDNLSQSGVDGVNKSANSREMPTPDTLLAASVALPIKSGAFRDVDERLLSTLWVEMPLNWHPCWRFSARGTENTSNISLSPASAENFARSSFADLRCGDRSVSGNRPLPTDLPQYTFRFGEE